MEHENSAILAINLESKAGRLNAPSHPVAKLGPQSEPEQTREAAKRHNWT
ncbi:hypothetical protein QG37_00284 [Candidozyma auris]|nr:hypothetical protein QG37_00284 [[Candida] auris]